MLQRRYYTGEIATCGEITVDPTTGAHIYHTLWRDTINLNRLVDCDIEQILDEIFRLRREFIHEVSRSFNNHAKDARTCDVWGDYVSNLANTVYGPEISRLEDLLYPVKNLNRLIDEEPRDSDVWQTVRYTTGINFDPERLDHNKWFDHVTVDMGCPEHEYEFTYHVNRCGINGAPSAECHKLSIVKREVKKALRKAVNH